MVVKVLVCESTGSTFLCCYYRPIKRNHLRRPSCFFFLLASVHWKVATKLHFFQQKKIKQWLDCWFKSATFQVRARIMAADWTKAPPRGSRFKWNLIKIADTGASLNRFTGCTANHCVSLKEGEKQKTELTSAFSLARQSAMWVKLSSRLLPQVWHFSADKPFAHVDLALLTLKREQKRLFDGVQKPEPAESKPHDKMAQRNWDRFSVSLPLVDHGWSRFTWIFSVWLGNDLMSVRGYWSTRSRDLGLMGRLKLTADTA